jgi:glycosyltransferase involved in cell wall biosynthesis
MKDAGLLDKAVGVELARLSKAWFLAKNYSANRTVWRKHFYFDPAYRNALTRAAAAIHVSSPVCLQVGSMFSLPECFPDKKCISYHDGCLAELRRSGFGLEAVSTQRIDQALRYEEQAAQSMTAIFTFSEYLRQAFIHDYRIAPEKVFNVGAGINFSTIPPVIENKDYSAPRILFVGKEFARKGGLQLLQAFTILRHSLPRAELHIAGPVHLDNLPEGVVYHGFLSKADPDQELRLQLLFQEASLFVLPSLYEPFGIAPLEAMLYRLPCLVTNAWALRETVVPGVNGDLVEMGSVDDLAQKMKSLLSDPECLAAMGTRAREMVLRQYTWPSVVERIGQAVRSL